MIPVVIPAKPLTRALGRLGAVIDQPTRRALQAAMLSDVLAAATAFSDHVIVVTADTVVADLARSAGAIVAVDADPPQGINHAVALGIGAAPAGAVLIVMGDVPGVTVDELRQVVTAAPYDGARSVTIAVSADGTGTNAMLLRPPDVITPMFGAGSLARHRSAARAAGVDCALVTAPGLALDIDTPDDLAAFAGMRASHTRELCAALGLWSAPPLSAAG